MLTLVWMFMLITKHSLFSDTSIVFLINGLLCKTLTINGQHHMCKYLNARMFACWFNRVHHACVMRTGFKGKVVYEMCN